MASYAVQTLIDYSSRQADRFNLPPSSETNDARDAFRHALVSAHLTRLFGLYAAKLMMDDHENQNPNGSLERKMDEHNNAAGRKIGLENPFGDLPAAVKEAQDNGKLVNDLDDPEINNGIDEPYIPQDPAFPDINPKTGDKYNESQNQRPRIDPLTLDLDGDGIETIGLNANNNVLFDHDGDGAKHGTGWVSSDDAMLVLDRNNNGTIDNGRELFGDNTQLANGRFAADGFAALAEMDSNGDGKINADDTQFANLRLWRDINQDGVSQSNELFTLEQYNIASLNVAKVENTTTLANGNQIADLGTFTKIDGNLVETTGNMADVNLLNDRFTREFANTLDTSAVQTLPDMQACTGMFLSSGSGALRDLREAANDATYCLAA